MPKSECDSSRVASWMQLLLQSTLTLVTESHSQAGSAELPQQIYYVGARIGRIARIAEVCGLSHSTVACVREECHTGEVLTRLGKDGRRRRMGSFVEESGSVASVSSRHVAPMRPAELDRSHGAGSGQYLGHTCVRDALPIDESVVDRSITELLGDTSSIGMVFSHGGNSRCIFRATCRAFP